MSSTVGIIGSGNAQQLEGFVKAAGLRPTTLQADRLVSPSGPIATPDVLLVDVRNDRGLLASVPAIKRRYPALGIVLVAASLDPAMMLEAMRAGVTECITDPLTQDSVDTAISRVMIQRSSSAPDGRVFAIVGAKGGVGVTTIAVNLAEAFAQEAGSSLILDLHAVAGDAAVFLGVEPKFTVAEALENTHRLDEAFFRSLVVHTKSGLDLLASPPGIASGHLDPVRVKTVVDFASRYYRAIVLDVPGSDGPLLDALDVASSIFVVLNQELPTVRAAYRLVAALRKRYGNDRVAVLLNRSDSSSGISTADIEKAVNAKIKHVFPSDYKLAVAAVNKGEPFAHSTQGRLPASFHALVRVLTGQQTGDPEHSGGGGLFGWLAPKRS